MRDIALALRGVHRRPLLSGIIALTLAVGISLTTVVFSVADRVLFRPLPYENSHELISISTVLADRPDNHSPMAAAVYTRLASGLPSLADVGSYRFNPLVVTAPEGPIVVQGAVVTTNLPRLLGLRPIMGPGFTSTPVSQPPLPETILTYGMWQTTFSADPNIVGRSVSIGGVPHTVVGVMPANTVFPVSDALLWTPMSAAPYLADEMRAHRQRYFTGLARLAPGATIARAKQELAVLAGRIATEAPQHHSNERLTARPFRDVIVGFAAPRVRLLFYAGALLLIIAAANAASVLWAHVLTRRGELAVRAALGASRWQLAKQLTIEGLVLGVIGGALGLLLAPFLATALRPVTEPFLPPVGLPVIDTRIVVGAIVACIACGLSMGLLPALIVSRAPLALALRSQTRGAGGGKTDRYVRGTLMVMQTSLCVALLVSAGLLIKSLLLLQRVDLMIDTAGVLTFEVSLPATRYATPAQQNQFYDALEAELRAIPGVQSASTGSSIPMAASIRAELGILGRDEPVGRRPEIGYFSVGPQYFSLLGTPLLAGRMLDHSTDDGEIVVNETMARRYWPKGDAVGAQIHVGPTQTGPWLTVVGIVGDMREHGPADSIRALSFGTNRRFSWPTRGVMLRTTGDPASFASAARGAVTRLDPSLPIRRLRTYDEIRGDTMVRERMSAILVGLFAGGALLLAMVGIYGLTAALVAARTREFGIRIALGAQRMNVLRESMRRGLALTALGLAVGLLGSAALVRLFASFIHGVRPFDVSVYVAVSLVLGATALVGTWLPSRRAMAVDPVVALRSE